MAIDWEKGEITSEQHRVRYDQMHPSIFEMQEFSVAYIDPESVRAGREGALWVDPCHSIYVADGEIDDDFPYENEDLYRLIKIHQGYVLDVSMDPPDRKYDTGFLQSAGSDLEAQGWIPVIGIIETSKQLKEFESILWHDSNIALILTKSNAQPTLDAED